jgi:hypothetical protein
VAPARAGRSASVGAKSPGPHVDLKN